MWFAESLVNCWTLGISSSLSIKLNDNCHGWELNERMQVKCSGDYLALIRRIINAWNWDWSSTNIPPYHSFNQFHSASFSPSTSQAHSHLLLCQFYLLPLLPFMSTYQCSYPFWSLERMAYLYLRTLSFAFSAAWETCSLVFMWVFSFLVLSHFSCRILWLFLNISATVASLALQPLALFYFIFFITLITTLCWFLDLFSATGMKLHDTISVCPER